LLSPRSYFFQNSLGFVKDDIILEPDFSWGKLMNPVLWPLRWRYLGHSRVLLAFTPVIKSLENTLRIPPQTCAALASASLLFLAGCGGAGMVSPSGGGEPIGQAANRATASQSARYVSVVGLPAGVQGFVRPGGYSGPAFMTPEVMTSSEIVYISDFLKDAIDIFKSTGGEPIGRITTGLVEPAGLWVDSKGTLYATNLGNGTVTEYAKGATSPFRTLSGTPLPEGVAASSTGDVYVSDFEDGVVNVYKHGSTTPSSSAALSAAEGIGINKAGDVLVGYNSGSGRVEEYKPGLVSGEDLGISIGMSGDVKIDKGNDLILSDQSNQVINIYKAGTTNPKRTISVSGHDPFKFCLDGSEKNIYVNDSSTATVLVYSYPAGKPKSVTFSGLTTALGVAVSPAAPY